jgi:hypothetical protein
LFFSGSCILGDKQMVNLKLALYSFYTTRYETTKVSSGQVFISIDFDELSWEVFGDRDKLWRNHIGWSETSDKWIDIQPYAIQLGETVETDDDVFIHIPLILWGVERCLPKVEGKGRIYRPKDTDFREGSLRWMQTTRKGVKSIDDECYLFSRI